MRATRSGPPIKTPFTPINASPRHQGRLRENIAREFGSPRANVYTLVPRPGVEGEKRSALERAVSTRIDFGERIELFF